MLQDGLDLKNVELWIIPGVVTQKLPTISQLNPVSDENHVGGIPRTQVRKHSRHIYTFVLKHTLILCISARQGNLITKTKAYHAACGRLACSLPDCGNQKNSSRESVLFKKFPWQNPGLMIMVNKVSDTCR